MFLLGRLGELARTVLLSRREKLPLADMFGIYALERIFDIASMAVIAAIALLLFQSNPLIVEATSTTGSLLFLGMTGGIAFMGYARPPGTALRGRRLQRLPAGRGGRRKNAGILVGLARPAQRLRECGRWCVA